MQKIASESMIPTYRSGADLLHKTNLGGNYVKHQPQQQNSSSISANAPKGENKNVVNKESNQNQCNSPVKRRSTSQIDVRNSSFFDFRFIIISSCASIT